MRAKLFCRAVSLIKFPMSVFSSLMHAPGKVGVASTGTPNIITGQGYSIDELHGSVVNQKSDCDSLMESVPVG